MNKLLSWLPKNLATILGIIQALVKLLKEILTGVVNILYPVIPSAKFQELVEKVRGFVNLIDAWIEKIKSFLLGANT